MTKKITSLEKLVQKLQHVPYLAQKNVYRVAQHFLQMSSVEVHNFCDVIQNAYENIIRCSICFSWQEKSLSCIFCADAKRDTSIVCVVETWQDLMAIEKTAGYQGLYHVLGGAIYPLEGIGPEDLAIAPLVRRVQKNSITEIILATNQTPEGEATAAFIAKQLSSLEVKISALARGVPVGASLEFIDRVTIYKALSNRRIF